MSLSSLPSKWQEFFNETQRLTDIPLCVHCKEVPEWDSVDWFLIFRVLNVPAACQKNWFPFKEIRPNANGDYSPCYIIMGLKGMQPCFLRRTNTRGVFGERSFALKEVFNYPTLAVQKKGSSWFIELVIGAYGKYFDVQGNAVNWKGHIWFDEISVLGGGTFDKAGNSLL